MDPVLQEPIVITGIGMIASLGSTRETVWQAVQQGHSRMRPLTGLRGIPDGTLFGATVDGLPEDRRLKVFELCEHAAREAVADAAIDFKRVDLDRFGCSLNAHMGDLSAFYLEHGLAAQFSTPWWEHFFPSAACSVLADKYRLGGPRLAHSTACASSLISIIAGVQAIRNRQCDIALVGGGDAINPLFAAGFHRMRVLATGDDPNQACKPFDRNRTGFVLGEGAGILVIERLGHALRRGAQIYAEIAAAKVLAEAQHVTSLTSDGDGLARAIDLTLKQARLEPQDVGYINAHGTGTEQNDLTEIRAIQQVFGPASEQLCVSATKSILGHMINAAGAAEFAITTLALRDGIAPPTRNLTDVEPECRFNCVPTIGRLNRFQNALKLSVAFGGHLVAVALRRWNDPATGFAYPAFSKLPAIKQAA